MTPSVLVIKLGALGDFVQALGPMRAIRDAHADAPLVLLTTEPYANFARASNLFDDIWIDSRPHGLQIGTWLALRRQLLGGGFSRVYDLQTSDRSSFYHRLFWPRQKPEWSGIAPGCTHPHANPERDFMHTIDRQREQLQMAGIDGSPAPDLGWVDAELQELNLAPQFALLAPGGARHRPRKRWPADAFIKLATQLSADSIQPVFIGGGDEAGLLGEIAAGVPDARNLAGQTSLLELAAMGRTATLAVGNDTGPMHLLAVAGCPCLVLYSDDSDPALCAQRGARVEIIRVADLGALTPETVITAAKGLLAGAA
ncbi:MAG: glycosyltransferase family 9 protein [Rhodospirillaceae bacterium]|nr:glycosyltransferase family 9 protein [Rhodospirillaceae bacterium]MBT7248149.1 glycosyltransferase family 9 protein [Rhodospirillaceae bacterium]MBT7512242.1 glycosyltransferase family 9 protein [Rhodospirillaceae bacterium]